jgi:hypothetical protein
MNFARRSLLVSLMTLSWACMSPDGASPGEGEGVEKTTSALTGSQVTLQINCGGPVRSPFIADTDWSGGNGTTSTTSTISLTGVTNPAPMAVYQDSRLGNVTYTAGGFTPNSTATVRLHFAETYFSANNQRTFNATINGTQVLTSFDIFKTAGAKNKATVQQFTSTADYNGTFTITFKNVINQTLVSGIEIIGLSPCAGALAVQEFGNGMVGCAGSVLWQNRGTLCGLGYHPATAIEWQSFWGNTAPTRDYWTNDNLGYAGSGTSSCAAVDPLNNQGNQEAGYPCPSGQPMRICTAAGTDPNGNQCNWTKCGLGVNSPNEYFGGCAGNSTAGTICMADAANSGVLNETGTSGPAATGYITGLNNVCVDLPSQVTLPGVGLDVHACNQHSGQSWALMPNGQIVGPNHQCMTVAGAGSAGSQVLLKPCQSPVPSNQYWDWPTNNTIQAVNLGVCLDVSGGNTADGTALIVNTCNGTTSQQWTIFGAAEIQGAGGLCMDILNGATANGTVVQGAACTGDVNQKWTLTPSGMIRGYNGVCLDLPTGSSNLDIKACDGTTKQKWTFSSGAPNPSHLVNTATSNCVTTVAGQLTAASGSCGSGKIDWTYATPLTVALRPQEQNEWCWAASGQMVMDYLGQHVEQCDEANWANGRTDCCTNPTSQSGACDNPGWPDFAHYGYSSTTVNSALSFASLAAQAQTAPVAYSWSWNGGGGHMMVVIGTSSITDTSTNTTTQYVEIDDPWSPNIGDQAYLTYTAWVSGSTYTHGSDIYGYTRTGWPARTTPVGTPAGYVRSDAVTAVVYANPQYDPVELCLGGPCGTSWVRNDFTTEIGAPAVPSGWLSPYVRKDGANAFVWIDYNGHVREASYLPGSWSWSIGDLTVATGSSVTANVGAASAYLRTDIVGAVTYADYANHIREMDLRGAYSWSETDVSGSIGAPTGNQPIGYVRPDGWNVIVYKSGGNVIELYWNPSTQVWNWGNLSAATGAPAVSTFDPIHPYAASDTNANVAAIVYRDGSNHIREIKLNGSWSQSDLTACSGAPAAYTPPVPYIRADGVNAVLFEDATLYHIYELERARNATGACPWTYTDLTVASGAGWLPAQGWANVATGFVRGDGVTSVLVETADSHVHEMNFQGTWTLAPYGADDLTPNGP